MLSRLFLGKPPVRMGRAVAQGVRATQFSAPIIVQSRTLIHFYPGSDKVTPEQKQAWREFTDAADDMGGEDDPYWKKEHLKGKDRRRMRANQLVGKSANYKVRALADVVHIKRRGKQQH